MKRNAKEEEEKDDDDDDDERKKIMFIYIDICIHTARCNRQFHSRIRSVVRANISLHHTHTHTPFISNT